MRVQTSVLPLLLLWVACSDPEETRAYPYNTKLDAASDVAIDAPRPSCGKATTFDVTPPVPLKV